MRRVVTKAWKHSKWIEKKQKKPLIQEKNNYDKLYLYNNTLDYLFFIYITRAVKGNSITH